MHELVADVLGVDACRTNKFRLFNPITRDSSIYKAAGVREKGGRKIQGLPDSFMFVIRCIGMVRGTCAHLGVSLPLVDIMATYARRGEARDRRLSRRRETQ